MYKLEIDSHKFELDGNWSVEEWMALQKYDITADFTWPAFISAATGAPIELCADIPEKTLEVGVALVKSLMQPAWQKPKKKYLSGELIEFDEMSIGIFIDCETAVGRGLDQWLHLLVASLYQVNPQKVLSWKIPDIWPAIHNYMNWRLKLYTKYKSLFNFNESDSEDTKNNSDAVYVWYDMLMILADEKFLNIDSASSRPVYEALNFLAWKKDMAAKEELERKKMNI